MPNCLASAPTGSDDHHGGTSFLVAGTEGPLDEGELARAHPWGAHLGRVADRKRV